MADHRCDSFIFPNPLQLHPQLSRLERHEIKWSPVRFNKENKLDYTEERETLLLLRALSQTSRRSRAVALPLLWSVVEIEGVNALGKLRDTLRLMPHLAKHVRYFKFKWWLRDEPTLQAYPDEYGSTLDMAFINRRALWNRIRRAAGVKPTDLRISFVYRYVTYVQPSSTEYNGPDGEGQDPRIENASDFNDACAEVISSFKSLKGFSWDCKVTPIPSEVFEILKARELLQLRANLWYTRKFQHCE